jgi:hypothetical protein
LRLFFALRALENKIIYGVDISNDFTKLLHLRRYSTCGLTASLSTRELHTWESLPYHTDTPNLLVYANVQVLGFVPTTHEPCIYRGKVNDSSFIFLCQVDDFAVALNGPAIYKNICDLFDARLNEPIKRLCLLRLYNGTNIEQTRVYIRLHNTSIIDKIPAATTWIGDTPRSRIDRPLPMNALSNTLRSLYSSPVHV